MIRERRFSPARNDDENCPTPRRVQRSRDSEQWLSSSPGNHIRSDRLGVKLWKMTPIYYPDLLLAARGVESIEIAIGVMGFENANKLGQRHWLIGNQRIKIGCIHGPKRPWLLSEKCLKRGVSYFGNW